MKAAVVTGYGPPDVVKILDVEKPVPKDDEVLIKVRAASVNPLDLHLMSGEPRVSRIFSGLRKPKVTRPGVDVAGRVEAVGNRVTKFKPGDEVLGVARGAFAVYVCGSESKLVLKPASVTFEQAAAAPVAALTALQGLRDKGKVRAGSKVLINGAAGGVGTFAVQIAKVLGANVTAVCSARNLDLVRSIGADRVIDYARDDFTQRAERYDVIFDLVANHPLTACRRVLKPGGTYVGAGVLGLPKKLSGFLGRALGGLVLSRLGKENFVTFIAKVNHEDLRLISEFLGSGKVKPIIDTRYKLTEIADAIRRMAGGHARGKIVVVFD